MKELINNFKKTAKEIADEPLSFQVWVDGTIYIFGSEKVTEGILNYFYPKYMKRGYSSRLGSWYLIVKNLKNINSSKLV